MSGWKKVEANIYFCGDANRQKPWLWKQKIDGVPYREFFFEKETAVAAKRAKRSSVAKYGSLAHEFDRDAYTEWREARKLLPDGVSLVDAARFWAQRHEGISDPDLTIQLAYDRFLKSKSADRKRMKKTPLSREHLSDLRWRGQTLVSLFGHLKPSEISSRQLLGLYAESTNAGRSILNQHETLRNFFNWCARKRYVVRNPYDEIRAEDLPDRITGEKHPLSLAAVIEIGAYFEEHWKKYCLWLALRLFAGIRTKEATRFRPEWIDRERRLIFMPGWERDATGGLLPGPKTRDDWPVYNIPSNFWAWYDAYRPAAGQRRVLAPHCKVWPKIRDGMIADGIIESFESNAFRDTFCTFNFSAVMDPKPIAAMMKHRNPDTMYRSYLGVLRPRWEGRAFRGIYPKAEPLELGIKN